MNGRIRLGNLHSCFSWLRTGIIARTRPQSPEYPDSGTPLFLPRNSWGAQPQAHPLLYCAMALKLAFSLSRIPVRIADALAKLFMSWRFS